MAGRNRHEQITCVCVMLVCLCVIHVSGEALDTDIYKVYSKGKTAYKKEKWSSCVKYIGTTISVYNRYKQTLLECAVKCKQDHLYTDVRSESPMDYILKGSLLSKRDCFVPCQQATTTNIKDGRHKSYFPKEFERMKPYYYLQYCLNKVTQVYNAASAAYTFLVRNPGYDDVLSTLGVYQYEHNIPDYAIMDLEERPYMKHRREGETAYRYRKWGDVIKHMESALKEYYQEEEKCHVQCDLGYTSNSSGLTQIIVDGISAVLECQRDCHASLSQLYGHTYPDYLTDHYLYLQTAYVQTDDFSNAIEAAKTYLTFKPDDETIIRLKNNYLGNIQKSDSEFMPRKDAVRYIETRKHITHLLEEFLESDHGKTKYHRKDGDGVEYTEEIHSTKPEPSVLDEIDHLSRLYDLQLFNTSRILENLFKTLRFNVTISGEALKHDKRVVMDGVTTKEECDDVMRISQKGIKNAGYHDHYPTAVRPNVGKELFTGIDIMECWNLVFQKQLKEKDVDLLTRLAEKARLLVKRWFNETDTVYHDYTQFTCRKALDGKQTNRTSEDLSHPIHGDSCDFNPDLGVCSKETAAYPWRTYSVVVYFNDNFEGGKFFFANADKSEQVSIVPKCGRMVAFPSDHIHGVKAITKGQRCAATIWFTATKSHKRHKPTFSGIIQ
ncbi:prolyl 3-hydroxylase 2-like [Pecten maximus]|uniref:prolyl 3-hydroxylase 2-like n=1 Tax=Pecten maximus TaxID=6579 RepID=UPI0014591A2C|nr:prolyl 3-hydroxylase 2-like [Pecten maximus]